MPITKLYLILLAKFIAFTVYYEVFKITDDNPTKLYYLPKQK